MDLRDYFKSFKGLGVLSTADRSGKVDSALYSRPHVVDDRHVAFIMGDRLSHANLKKNPYAVYLFKEEGEGYEGKRLYLKKQKEIDDQEVVMKMCKTVWPSADCEQYAEGSFLVYFEVEKVLPLKSDEEK